MREAKSVALDAWVGAGAAGTVLERYMRAVIPFFLVDQYGLSTCLIYALAPASTTGRPPRECVRTCSKGTPADRVACLRITSALVGGRVGEGEGEVPA